MDKRKTKTKNIILSYLVEYKRAHDGNSPSIRQITEGCNLSSTSVVAFHLRKLERDGKIRLTDHAFRNIEITGGQWIFES